MRDIGRAEVLSKRASKAKAAGNLDDAASLTARANRNARNAGRRLENAQRTAGTRFGAGVARVALYTGDQDIARALGALSTRGPRGRSLRGQAGQG